MGWRVPIVEIFMPLWDERIQFQDSSPPVCVFERWDVWTRWKCASNHRNALKKRFKSFINVNQSRIISCFRLFHTTHWSVTGGAAANDRLIICSTDSDSTELTPFYISCLGSKNSKKFSSVPWKLRKSIKSTKCLTFWLKHNTLTFTLCTQCYEGLQLTIVFISVQSSKALKTRKIVQMPKADFYKLLVKLKEVQFSIMKDDEKHQILMI